MAHTEEADMEATLLTLLEQQEKILKCVQSWQAGQESAIGVCLGRLDDKVDLLLASDAFSRGAAREEVERSVASIPSASSMERYDCDGIAQNTLSVSEPPGQPAGGFFQHRALLQPAWCSEPDPCVSSSGLPSFSLPHRVSEVDPEPGAIRSTMLRSPTRPGAGWRESDQSTTRTKSIRNYINATTRRELMAKQPRIVRATKSPYFEVVCSAMIILNVVSICWQTQVTASRVEDAFVSGAAYDDSVPAHLVAVQSFFTAFFVLEVGMRWAAAGFTRFLRVGDCIWNWFDVLIVSAGLLHQLSLGFQIDTPLGTISAVRCLRVLRLLRVFRTLRFFVFFRELRMLIGSCIGGLKSYVWCCCINLLLVLIFGIALATRTCTYIMTSEQYADDEDARLLQEYFGTLDKAMLSLAQAATGGRDWYEFYDLLRVVGAVDCLLLLLYLSFAIYVLANAAAAIFVEGAMNHAKHDTELVIKQQLERGTESRKKLLDVFGEMDLDDSGTLTLEEFSSHLEDDRVVAYFDAFQLDVSYAPEIFSMLDVDGSGKVDIQEFIDGCIKLKGNAKHLELCLLQQEITSINQNLRDIQKHFERWTLPNAVAMQSGHQASSTRRMCS